MFSKSFNLINSGAYIGTRKNNWVPESEKFLLGYKNKISIYNVAISSFFLQRALNFVSGAVSMGARGFFFGLINFGEEISNSSILNYKKLDQVVTKKNWRGGYITNTKFFRSAIFNGTKKFSFIVSFKFDYTNFPTISEASRMRLPLIMPVDSNSPVSYFMYPIPSNSTGSGIIQIYAYEFSNAVFKGIYQKIAPFSAENFSKTLKYPGRGKGSFPNKQHNNNINANGRRWNRTTAVSFSGLNSTIELSPLYKTNTLVFIIYFFFKYGKNF